ncbi:hypothetical protein F2Q70_00017993 [Brassica cretica]|uniref:Uncharacterized protein n=1 Tax=Brassica cretica TaxID=69181 RepID=A0A8S9I4X2_BRACR|nr:hypothetical protein F2Q70_00017993 [Brassica cretica]
MPQHLLSFVLQLISRFGELQPTLIETSIPSDPNSFGAQHVLDSMTSASWMMLFIHCGLLSSKTRALNLH